MEPDRGDEIEMVAAHPCIALLNVIHLSKSFNRKMSEGQNRCNGCGQTGRGP
jgi:hypothetical protein